MRTGFGFVNDHRWVVALVVVAAAVANVLLVRSLGDGAPAATSTSGAPPATANATRTERWLVDLDENGIALRVRSGNCETYGATVERSVDGGLTWADITDDLRDVVVVRRVLLGELPPVPPTTAEPAPAPRISADVVGTRNGCETDVWKSTDAGLTWEWVGDPGGLWYPRGEANRQVHAPSGDVKGPCPSRGTAVDVTDDQRGYGIVLCSDGQVSRSRDGVSWLRVGKPIPGASSVSFTLGRGYAVSRVKGCFGAAVLQLRGGAWEQIACVPDVSVPGSALVVRGTAGLLVSYSGTWRTEDGGKRWKPTE